MRLIISIFLLCLLNYASCKTHSSRSLTESMGQEVIEIGAPIKDLPQELEEEPSGDSSDERPSTTTTTVQAATKKEIAKTTFIKMKGGDINDDRMRQDDDEAKVEQEIAEIYKDLDYKSDSDEDTKEVSVSTSSKATAKSDVTSEATSSKRTTTTTKPVERARKEFKFQPDSSNPREIAYFRTSIDEITCDKKLSATEVPRPANTASHRFVADLILTTLLYTVCM